jgi:hypothetical protein
MKKPLYDICQREIIREVPESYLAAHFKLMQAINEFRKPFYKPLGRFFGRIIAFTLLNRFVRLKTKYK